MDKDIAIKINKELVKFRRYGMRCSHILVGRKEYEEICKPGDVDEKFDEKFDEEFEASPGWSVELVNVDEDSYFAGAYVVDEEEMQAKRLAELTKSPPPPPPPPKRIIREDIQIGKK